MRQNAFLLVVVIAVSLVLGIWFGIQRQSTRSDQRLASSSSLSFVDFVLPDVQGKQRRLSQWRGKVVVLNFWATWCSPCLEEIPLFIYFQEKYKDQGLQIIGVAIDSRDNVVKFRQALPINYPVLIDTGAGMKIMEQYGNRVGSLPYSVMIDRDGRIFNNKIGAYSRAELAKLLSPRFDQAKTSLKTTSEPVLR
jgi:thiol-disulfide isomerase/thioredoxin